MKSRHIGKKIGPRAVNFRNRNRAAKRSVFISYNFSDIEDNVNGFWIIRELANTAGNNAAAEAKAAGLSRAYIRNYKDLIKINANGEETTISPRIKRSSFYVKYKPSTILHAIRK